ILEYTGVDYLKIADDEPLRAAAAGAGLSVDRAWNRAKIIDELMSQFVEPHLIQPTFVIDHPGATPPRARRRPRQPGEGVRFAAYMGGVESASAFGGLDDPVEQRRRLAEQVVVRAAGDQRAQVLDRLKIVVVERLMPPTGGLGV